MSDNVLCQPTRGCRPGGRDLRRAFPGGRKYLAKALRTGRLQFFGSLEKLADAQQFRSYLAPLEQSDCSLSD